MTEKVVRDELMLEARRTIKNLSTVGGLRAITVFPFALLHKLTPVEHKGLSGMPTSVD